MEVIALLLAGAGVVAGFVVPGLTAKDRKGIVATAAIIAGVAIFALASDSWALGEGWVVFAAAPLAVAGVQAYKARARRDV